MTKNTSREFRNWTSNLTLSPTEVARVRSAVRSEIDYYNHLLSVFSTRARTKPEFLKSLTGPFETVVVHCASSMSGLRSLSANAIPRSLVGLSGLLFDGTGKSRLTEAEHFFFDQIGAPNGLHADTRAMMALEMLRFHRVQAAAFTAPAAGEYVYRSAIETLTPLDETNRRHVQIQRKAVQIEQKDRTSLITVPYLDQPIVINTLVPSNQWTLMILRDDGASIGMELRQEPSSYLLRKKDHRLARARKIG